MGICKEREINPCRSSVSKIDCWISFSQKNPLIAARICLIWSNPSLNIRVLRCSCKKVTYKSKSQITDSHEVKLGLDYKSGNVVRWSSKLSKLRATYTLCFAPCMNFVGNLSLFKTIFKSYNLAKHLLYECK